NFELAVIPAYRIDPRRRAARQHGGQDDRQHKRPAADYATVFCNHGYLPSWFFNLKVHRPAAGPGTPGYRPAHPAVDRARGTPPEIRPRPPPQTAARRPRVAPETDR